MATTSKDKMVLVGAITGAHGVRGLMKIKSFTHDPAAICEFGQFYDEQGAPLLTPTQWQALPKGLGLMAASVTSREQADAMRHTPLYVRRADLPALAEDEDDIYIVDLIGLNVLGVAGEDLGRVKDVEAGMQDRLLIENTPDALGVWALPFTKALVPVVDVAAGHIIANVPLGLIPYADAMADKDTQDDNDQ